MPQWLNPGRHADRLLAAAFDVSDDIGGPSAFANGTIFTFLDDALDAEEGMTENARDGAGYLVRLGYILRLVEEAERTARPFDPRISGSLQQARVEFPARRQALLDAALDESGSEMERDCLRRLNGAGDSEHYNGESEVFDELVLLVVGEAWPTGSRATASSACPGTTRTSGRSWS